MAGGPHAPGQAGAPPNHRKRKAPVPAAAAGDEAETEVHALGREVEEVEESLAELDRRVLEHLRGTAVDRLAALRPPARQEFLAVSETPSSEEDQEQPQKLNILKSKIEANIADLSKVLEKMHESVARCEKLENLHVNIDPIFRTRRLYHG
ncbi:hypothetical protein GQ55_8G133000 [Panicum hallii var. hallii]|uniref:Uncharacterized protein n=1 Tax=Panicum hallii var. hallii TaxID=1504633 RepID=A0A2T7CN16_9POAL|nr:hypothetical protein GQ55_8G133000 [Panicum hallii var. hallii]